MYVPKTTSITMLIHMTMKSVCVVSSSITILLEALSLTYMHFGCQV